MLAQAGLPNGFSFELQYGAGDFASVSYQLLAEKVQADLKRVGISVTLRPMDAVNFRTQFMNGKSTSVLTYWTGNMDVSLWALTEQCNYIVLFQLLFQVAARRSVTNVDLTAIGGVIEMGDVRPA